MHNYYNILGCDYGVTLITIACIRMVPGANVNNVKRQLLDKKYRQVIIDSEISKLKKDVKSGKFVLLTSNKKGSHRHQDYLRRKKAMVEAVK
jgi:hypothetical protein